MLSEGIKSWDIGIQTIHVYSFPAKITAVCNSDDYRILKIPAQWAPSIHKRGPILQFKIYYFVVLKKHREKL